MPCFKKKKPHKQTADNRHTSDDEGQNKNKERKVSVQKLVIPKGTVYENQTTVIDLPTELTGEQILVLVRGRPDSSYDKYVDDEGSKEARQVKCTCKHCVDREVRYRKKESERLRKLEASEKKNAETNVCPPNCPSKQMQSIDASACPQTCPVKRNASTGESRPGSAGKERSSRAPCGCTNKKTQTRRSGSPSSSTSMRCACRSS